MQPAFEMADVLNVNWATVQQSEKFNRWQLRTLHAVRRCRTAALGAHVDGCTSCGHLRISYNSCRNRHCPKCRGNERVKWIQAREQELLPVPYFHVVFTMPDTLNTICLHQPSCMYNILFHTAWSVLNSFGNDHKWLGCTKRHDRYFTHLGTNIESAPTPALHCTRRRLKQTGKVEDSQNQW